MTVFVAVIDGIMAAILLIIMTSNRMASLPTWHRLWIAFITIGLAGQFAAEFAQLDQIRFDISILKDVGLWGLIVTFLWQEIKPAQ